MCALVTGVRRVLFRSATSSPHVHQLVDLPEELQASWRDYTQQFFGEVKTPESLADYAFIGSDRSEPEEEENEEENPFKRAARKIGTAPLPKGPGRVIARNEGALPNFRTTFLYGANAAIEGLDLAPMSVADVLTPDIIRIVIDVQHERPCKRAVERGDRKSTRLNSSH